ncbi:MAG: pantoate--beta-alanine ligase [Burkholderiaceae bacterium]
MYIAHTIADLRQHMAQFKHPAFVPTMGNLHAGHLALIQQAKPLGDVTVSSIFVNRLQFAPHEDFDTYPRTFEADCEKLKNAGCDVVFAPTEKELYPEPQTFKISPPTEVADILEGHFRPGFFVGVSTVVMKLFTIVFSEAQGQRTALFGKKDYQQLMVIKRMVQQFALPINVTGGETQRADDGLALSSRNGYLSADERAEAVQLSLALKQLAAAYRENANNLAALEQQALDKLAQRGWKPDYLTVRRRADLQAPQVGFSMGGQSSDPLVVLGAAKLGNTRLIDNLEF